jgi:choline-sulfatase
MSERRSRAVTATHPFQGMNVVLFITDQERAIQHFPKDWRKDNMPGAQYLADNGLSFERACCNACMCSPSRATLMTGYFPAQHGVKWTLEENMTTDATPQQTLPLDLPNLATVMKACGYSTPYRGKFHLTKPATPNIYKPEDVNQYGFEGWDCPDAGANQDTDQFGGGYADHDGRYMKCNGPEEFGQEGVLAYLKSKDATSQPFFLTVSLVNPHDVLAYPNTAFYYGYTPEWTEGTIGLPKTWDEDLTRSKPSAQNQFLQLTNSPNGLGPLDEQTMVSYLNFYGNLMIQSDKYLQRIIATLKDQGLLDNTLIIKTSDHGEMGMAHGGLRQKCFNMYEETLRVPLIFSNPKLWGDGKKRESGALVSHVDFLPTMANLFGAPESACAEWEGVDYSAVILDPDAEAPQDYTVFTFDDYQSGQASPPYPCPNNHIVSLREERYKIAKYYPDPSDPAFQCPFPAPNGGQEEWEMYDLKHDPLELINIAHHNHRSTCGCRRSWPRWRRRACRRCRRRKRFRRSGAIANDYDDQRERRPVWAAVLCWVLRVS